MRPAEVAHAHLPAHASATLFVALLVVVAGCGSSGAESGTSSPGTNATVSGTAVKGPVNGASVAAFAVTEGAKGAPLATTTTDAQGQFTVSLGGYSGPVMLVMSGGSYVDEATGTTMPLLGADALTAVIPSISAGATTTGIAVTPLTSMAQARAQAMPGGMTEANAAAANAAVGAYFMIGDLLHTMPMDPLVQGSGAAATQDQKNCGIVIAAMSAYAHALGMTSSSGMVTAMMNDASDGVMNGMVGGTPIGMAGMGGMMSGTIMQPTAGTTSLATAMTQFMSSAMNKSGVSTADLQPLVAKLSASNGTLQ